MAQQQVNLQRTMGEEPPASQDEIRKRAYEIYCSRNGGLGNEVDDWLKAESELRQGRASRWEMSGNSRRRNALSGGFDRQGRTIDPSRRR